MIKYTGLNLNLKLKINAITNNATFIGVEGTEKKSFMPEAMIMPTTTGFIPANAFFITAESALFLNILETMIIKIEEGTKIAIVANAAPTNPANL